jgi:hypothetical protein
MSTAVASLSSSQVSPDLSSWVIPPLDFDQTSDLEELIPDARRTQVIPRKPLPASAFNSASPFREQHGARNNGDRVLPRYTLPPDFLRLDEHSSTVVGEITPCSMHRSMLQEKIYRRNHGSSMTFSRCWSDEQINCVVIITRCRNFQSSIMHLRV